MKVGIGFNLRISGVERLYIYDIYLMFLSRYIYIKLCQNYTKIYIYEILYKSIGINRSYSANTQTIWIRLHPTETWESQVCSHYMFLFLFCIFFLVITIFYQIEKIQSIILLKVRITLQELPPRRVQYTGHVIQTEFWWPVYCTAIGWSSCDVIRTIRTICNNVINYIYKKCKIYTEKLEQEQT